MDKVRDKVGLDQYEIAGQRKDTPRLRVLPLPEQGNP